MSTARILLQALVLFALIALPLGLGCTPNPPVMPEGPQSTKTGYSVTYKLNGRTDSAAVNAAGEIPTAGNETFRAPPPAPSEEKKDEKEEKKSE
jgi:hypothetical protein